MENKLTFKKINYILLLSGIAVLALGFIIMTFETAEHGYGILGLTVGPIVIMTGFGIQFAAILYKPKK